ncbi:hypothetical protein BKA65DRAFT_75592 [Rhexocercosporidium sp. MPI-PUGE-AT-0058]|nr:hypothetical protein BKA65DRAFT_75592 [Rhexocercosporidium sp. MPI-PUGE-AT-0058]
MDVLVRRSGLDIPSEIVEAFKTNATGIPDYVTPEYLAESQNHVTNRGIIFLVVFAGLIYLLRAYGRLFMIKSFGLDDWLAGFSLLCYITFSGLCIGIINTGAARHNEYVQYIMTNSQLDLAQILDFWAHLIYATALFVCRMSGLAFYHRLCDGSGSLIWTIRGSGVFLVAGYIPQIFLIVFHCKPVTALWPNYFQPNVNDYKCLPWVILYATNSSISILSDLILFVIPIVIILKLKAAIRTKLALSAVLLPGVLVIVISIFRLWIVIQSNGVFIDTSWVYGPQLVIECAEVGSTIIALSIPGLKPLFQNWFSLFNLQLKSYSRSRGLSRPTHNTSTNITEPGLSHADYYARAPSESSVGDRQYPLSRAYGADKGSDDDLLDMEMGNRKQSPGIEVTTTIMQMRDLAKKEESR